MSLCLLLLAAGLHLVTLGSARPCRGLALSIWDRGQPSGPPSWKDLGSEKLCGCM